MKHSPVTGKIITFYSYKGGTGRSMALANVAWILASQGQRVLMVDWDLEAPGLHRYFHPFLLDKELSSTRGLIDLVWDFATEAMTPVKPNEREKGWHEEYANILRYAIAVRWRFRNDKGRIDLVPPGKQGPSYASRVNSFNWQNFYERLGGGVFLEAVKETMRANYDYIFIDSRTGVSDTSGICTVQMPDMLVVFYTANTQSIDGAAAVAASVHEHWSLQPSDPHNKLMPLQRRIFPIMTRVELGEKDKLDLARTYARAKFDRVLDHLSVKSRTEYWAGAETLYVPWYAYEEVLATFGDKQTESNSLLASAERLTAVLTNGAVTKLDPPDESERVTILNQFSRGSTSAAVAEQAAYDVYISYSQRDREWVRSELLPSLQEAGLKTFIDIENIAPGDRWADALSDALQRSRQVLAVMSPSWTKSESAQHELHAVLNLDRGNIKVVPVLLEPCEIPTELQGISYADLTNPSRRSEAMHQLLHSLGASSKAGALQLTWEKRAASVDISRIVKYAPSELIGRETETKLLNDAWDKVVNGEVRRPQVLTVVGLGGEGKTSLVAKWAAELAHQDWPGCDAVFAWSFYSQGARDQVSASSDLFIKEALTFFGDGADKEFAVSNAGSFEKGRRLAGLVGRRRSLLILDGLEPLQYAPTSIMPGQLKDQGMAALLTGLAANNDGLCVVTTRYSLPELKAFWQTTAPEVKLLRLSGEAGSHLLKMLGVKGTDKEFRSLVEDLMGHALTLTLLGSFLVRAFNGDIRKRDLVNLQKADDKMDGGQAFRTLAALEQWLLSGGDEGQREVAVLRLMGLFDRPADAGCLAALRSESITGLTEPLASLTDDDWEFCLSGLEASKLLTVNRDSSGGLVTLDAHPLLREYFAQQLRERQPEAWRAAHRRLYEYLCASTQDLEKPTLEDLQPLYQAVAHGCLAQLQQETFETVYRERIQRGSELYSKVKLGAFAADLKAVSLFFEPPWRRISSALSEPSQAWLLNDAAFSLRALGRLTEAVEPMRAGLEKSDRQHDWKNAAESACNLSELALTLGDLASALADAEQAVNYADRSADAFQRISNRATRADALHQAGRTAEAKSHFGESEQIQHEWQPHYPLLYSLQGFRYCDLLLANPERAAWRLVQGSEDKNQRSELVAECRSVAERAAGTLKIAGDRNLSLLTLALDHLTLGRSMFYAFILDPSAVGNRESANENVTAAVASLRRAAAQEFIVRGLLTRAWLRFLTGASVGPESAQEDLDEAWEIAERGPMRLHMADIHLHRARLFHGVTPYPWTSPQEDLVAARKLIEQCGYWRRKDELEDAEAAARDW